ARPESLGERELGGREPHVVLPLVGGRVAGDAGAEGITAGQERRARGSADGRGAAEAGEARALCRHAVEVRGLPILLAVRAQVAPAEVVGEDQHDVRRALGGGQEAGEASRRQERQRGKRRPSRAGSHGPRSLSSRSAESSATASRSFGRPAARFTWISFSRSRHLSGAPKTLSSIVCGRRSSYPPPPVISPRRSRSPASVVRVKFSPASTVRSSHWKGRPAGAPRR